MFKRQLGNERCITFIEKKNTSTRGIKCQLPVGGVVDRQGFELTHIHYM